MKSIQIMSDPYPVLIKVKLNMAYTDYNFVSTILILLLSFVAFILLPKNVQVWRNFSGNKFSSSARRVSK